MDNVMPEYTPEQLDAVVKKKGDEIMEMFKTAVNDQITDAVTAISPNLVHEVAKACSLAHIKPFQDPLNKIPKDMVNGAALERLQLVKDFWGGVETYLNSL